MKKTLLSIVFASSLLSAPAYSTLAVPGATPSNSFTKEALRHRVNLNTTQQSQPLKKLLNPTDLRTLIQPRNITTRATEKEKQPQMAFSCSACH